MKRFVVAYHDEFEGVIDMLIVTAETAFDACVNYLVTQCGYELDNDILEQCEGSIDTLACECLTHDSIAVMELI